MDAATFAALGEPSRFRIVELLRVRPFSVGDIADKLGIRQPQVSKHLGVCASLRTATDRVQHRLQPAVCGLPVRRPQSVAELHDEADAATHVAEDVIGVAVLEDYAASAVRQALPSPDRPPVSDP